MKRVIVVVLTTLVCMCVSLAEPQTSSTAAKKSTPNASATKASAKSQPEQYHAVDTEKAGFKIVFSVTQQMMGPGGKFMGAVLGEVLLDDDPSPVLGGRRYEIELTSHQVNDDGLIHTKDYGDLKVNASDFQGVHIMMKDSQIAKLQAFLKSQKKGQ